MSGRSTIKLKVYLIKNGNQEEKEASCVSESNISIINERKEQADFICTVEGSSDDIIIISSDDISGINDSLEDYQKSPKKTDEIIKETRDLDSSTVGKLYDFSSPEYKNIFPPTLTINDIETNLCNKYGKLTIIGKFDTDINEEYDFDLTFSYPSATIKCTVPSSKINIQTSISCYSKNDFNGDSQILIEYMTIKKKYKEILLIKSFNKETSISCRNYESIKSEKLEKKNTASYTFLQMNSFKVDTITNKPSFNLFIYSTIRIPFGTSIIVTIFININIFRNRFILRNLEEVEAQAECKPDKEYEEGNAKFICETIVDDNNNIDFSKAVGLNIDSEEISGIPENADPAQTDIDIVQGIVPDYNNEVVLKAEIPKITGKSINGTTCNDTGNFEIYGETEHNIKNINNFDLLISVPSVSSFCNVSSNNNNVKFSCSTKDKFNSQKISIEKQMIQKNGTTLFILSNVSSTDEFSCTINSDYKLNTPIVGNSPNETTTDTIETTTPIGNRNVKNRFYNSKASSGLSGGAIAAIIIVCVVAVIAIGVLISLIKSGKLLNLKNKNEILDMNNSSTVNAVVYNP